MLAVSLLAVLVLVSVVVRLAERVRPDGHDAAGDPSPAVRAWRSWRARRRALPLLPVGHRPPPGLGPLSPSERFLRSETERGIRAMQLWLLDQDGSPA